MVKRAEIMRSMCSVMMVAPRCPPGCKATCRCIHPFVVRRDPTIVCRQRLTVPCDQPLFWYRSSRSDA